ncbi:hypothetical protein ENBRE01_2618 [Enteropsectra breve]|nr:hypothetical protein ENBRE01_2618 [Enteropsectra breve]
MDKPVFYIHKLASFLNIFNKSSANANINPTALSSLHMLVLLTCAIYTIPPVIQVLLYLLSPKYYTGRMPTKIDRAWPKMIYGYVYYTAPKALLSAAVLLMCKILTVMVKNESKSIAFQVLMNFAFYMIVLHLLYKPFTIYKAIFMNRAAYSTKFLLSIFIGELLTIFSIYLTRSSIFHQILYYEFVLTGKEACVGFVNTLFPKTSDILATVIGRLQFHSEVERIESVLTRAGMTDFLEEIKLGIACKGYDINKIYMYNDNGGIINAFACSNSYTDCILISRTYINSYAQNPKVISAVLIHEITHIENNDPNVLKTLSFIVSMGSLILPLLWVALRWNMSALVESFLCVFILSRLWELVLLIPANLYQNHCELRADRGLSGTGYEEHMITFMKGLFYISPISSFGLNYDISAINWLFFKHPANLYRVDKIKKRM